MASATMTRGDEVMFERLDVADALGIWRNAKGRVVGIHGQDGRTPTIDVAFDGHEILHRYLPDIFRRVQSYQWPKVLTHRSIDPSRIVYAKPEA